MPPKTTDKSSKPGILTVIQETVQTDITPLTVKAAGDICSEQIEAELNSSCNCDRLCHGRAAMMRTNLTGDLGIAILTFLDFTVCSGMEWCTEKKRSAGAMTRRTV
jgi:hypothetical protein